ncbi:inhibitory POU isoform X2 [Brachionus plicatilis]|uniref:POU domain protein n=1 Tax=Brachionus plicatilis TaxID=10195 RepID=A0A3M7QLR9_BRAPC|nr:inhibitory POU isoform X2 [Brachionus plicatilis]
MDNFKFEPAPANLFPGIEDSFLARAEAAVAAAKHDNLYHPLPNRISFENSNESERASSTSSLYHHQNSSGGSGGGNFAEANSNAFYNAFYASHQSSGSQITQHASAAIAAAAAAAASIHQSDLDIDPRELENFAEKFKQRRIKLGVTQADVGQQLSKLKLPGVGSLSQSTICRFESLTLSHNNMIALKPVLHAWLEQAEIDARSSRKKSEEVQSVQSVHGGGAMMGHASHHREVASERKRKRTSIAAPEKRSLEAYFSVQPRPSGEKIAQIAEKLELKKNVVRVWFCNQRQKQKRMKFAAIQSR